ncbi:VENN motif pre-toxin domain-containing protein [Neisseriaceae bacterium ESL0693]|nr:VENN motif pre-toxin domain-containing protein [Neisseriaceae bacterium ESL0693]
MRSIVATACQIHAGGSISLNASGSASYSHSPVLLRQRPVRHGQGDQLTTAQEAAHLLAHAALGAAVAATGGNNALVGAASAAGAEAAAPALAHWLYDKDPSDLTSDEKQTISSIVGLAGAAMGATTGNSADIAGGFQGAQNAVDNNTLVLTGNKLTKTRYLDWMNKAQAQDQYKYILDSKNRIIIEGYHYDDSQNPPVLIANDSVINELSPSGIVNQTIVDAIKKNEDIYLRLQSDPKYIEQNKILIDYFGSGDVDATQDFFQNSDLQALTQTQLHLIHERTDTPDYEETKLQLNDNPYDPANNIDTIFNPHHMVGKQTEIDYLQEQFPDKQFHLPDERPINTAVSKWKGYDVIEQTWDYGDKKFSIYFSYKTDPITGMKVPQRPIGVSYQ